MYRILRIVPLFISLNAYAATDLNCTGKVTDPSAVHPIGHIEVSIELLSATKAFARVVPSFPGITEDCYATLDVKQAGSAYTFKGNFQCYFGSAIFKEIKFDEKNMTMPLAEKYFGDLSCEWLGEYPVTEIGNYAKYNLTYTHARGRRSRGSAELEVVALHNRIGYIQHVLVEYDGQVTDDRLFAVNWADFHYSENVLAEYLNECGTEGHTGTISSYRVGSENLNTCILDEVPSDPSELTWEIANVPWRLARRLQSTAPNETLLWELLTYKGGSPVSSVTPF